MKKLSAILSIILIIGCLHACSSKDDKSGSDETGAAESKDKITFGATSGPYSDMVNKAIKPLLEEKGYEVENIEFSDYIQPNNALDNGDIDANLFQHKIYYEAFAEEK